MSLVVPAASARSVLAMDKVAGASASLRVVGKGEVDTRSLRLKRFLDDQKSPLAKFAEVFVKYADINGLDWRLVPAISGVESSFGKRIPYGSYNAYGWANGTYRFGSWESSIEVVSRTLNEKYFAKGATTIEDIGRKYAPSNKFWAGRVKYFMKKIDPLPPAITLDG